MPRRDRFEVMSGAESNIRPDVQIQQELTSEAWRVLPDTFMHRLSGGQLVPPKHLRVLSYFMYLSATGVLPRITVSMPPGHAKALALDTPIPTPDGWSTIKEIEPDGFVLNEAGWKTRVIAKSEVFYGNDCYELEFSNGDVIVADGDHLWVADDINQPDPDWRVKSTIGLHRRFEAGGRLRIGMPELSTYALGLLEQADHRRRRALPDAVRIVRVEQVESVPTQCISVENSSSLFLAGRAMVPTHNSTLISRYYPAWLFSNWPDMLLILSTYADTFAEEHGKAVRGLLSEHSELVGVRLDTSSQAANRWKTQRGGGMWTAGTGGVITGRRARCFPAGTSVLTEIGACRIEDITQSSHPPRVWAADPATGRPELCDIEAARVDFSDDIYELTTRAGRTVRATGDHPFWTSTGWVELRDLEPGDVLLGASPQIGGHPVETLPGMRDADSSAVEAVQAMRLQRPRRPGDGNGDLQDVRGDVLPPGVRHAEIGGVLLSPLRRGRSNEAASGLSSVRGGTGEVEGRQVLRWVQPQPEGPVASVAPTTLSDLWGPVHPDFASDAALLSIVRERKSRPADGWPWELAVQGRPLVRSVVPRDASADLVSGRAPVRGVRRTGAVPRVGLAWPSGPSFAPGDPSHQRGSDGQPCGEPDLAVRDVPCGAPQVERDAVAVVRRVGGPAQPVYDLQVAGRHCFFAGEVLAHNCFLIDDPHKNFQDAHSPTMQEHAWQWYLSTARTRLLPGASIVALATRWAEGDLIGRLHEQPGSEWVHVRFPALAEQDETIDEIIGPDTARRLRELGVVLPEWRRKQGEALWPTITSPETGLELPWFDEEEMAATKREVGEYVWAGMYQQRPTILGGGLFPVDRWLKVDDFPSNCRMARCWDLAASEKKGDYTVGALLARSADGRVFVLDVARDRVGPADVERMVKAKAVEDVERYGRNRVEIQIEQEGGSAGKLVASYWTRQVLAGYPAEFVPSSGDKVVRAMPWAAQVQAGNVALVRQMNRDGRFESGEWFDAWVTEHAAFPNGRNDDQVDAGAGAFGRLAGTAPRYREARVQHRARHRLDPMRPRGR